MGNRLASRVEATILFCRGLCGLFSTVSGIACPTLLLSGRWSNPWPSIRDGFGGLFFELADVLGYGFDRGLF